MAPNPYEVDEDGRSRDKTKRVNIKMLDVLFDSEICNLVFMTDLNQAVWENEQSVAKENLMQVSEMITEEV